MKKKNKNNNVYLMPILYIVIGALFCVFKADVIGWIMTIAGVLFIVNGIIQIVHKEVTTGVINIVIGAVIITFGWTLLWLAMLVFGILLIVSSIVNYLDNKKNNVAILKLVISVIIGTLLITNGFATISWLFIAIGVILIVQGILYLIPIFKK